MTQPPVVLASGSPRRREVLRQIGLEFEVQPAPDEVEQAWDGETPPAEYATETALAKATAVSTARKDALVIAADTIVVLDDEVLGKPADAAGARSMLGRLAGREHIVQTGIAVVAPGGARSAAVETTRVVFRLLSAAQIAAYVETGEPLDKAGAYGIQGIGATLVESVNGCYFNVMGLPVSRLLALFHDVQFAYDMPGRIRPREPS